MPFKTDEQRKAAFARMNSKERGGGPGRGRPSLTHPGLEAVVKWMLGSGKKSTPKPWTGFVSNGPGIQGSQAGTVTLTGGAIYSTPGSQWYIYQPPPETPAYFGQLPSQGVAPVVQVAPTEWTPPTSLFTSLVMIASGVDPNSGNMLPPPGTPGTLKGALALDMAHQITDRNAGSYNAFVGGVGRPPSRYSGRSNKQFSGWIIDLFEGSQKSIFELFGTQKRIRRPGE